MSSFKTSEIQYISRDYCQLITSKPLVYLHYVDHAYKYPNAAYQHVLKSEPFGENTTEESIINEFKAYEKSIINASQKARLLTFIKSFQLEYPGIIDDIKVYPNYTVEVVNLSNMANSTPDVSIVWEINRIAPAMCGMIFENMIAEALDLKWEPSDLSSVLLDCKSNITNKTLAGLIERNFIKHSYLRANCHVSVDDNMIVHVGYENLNANHFMSYWHYLVYMSLTHFMKRDLKGQDVENALNILEYMKEHFEDIDCYFDCLSNSTLIKNMSNMTGLNHGLMSRQKDLHGECDFISNEAIIDIKCYREETLDDWMAQLWLYEQLFGNRPNLWIVNVYNNKVYKFSHK